MSKSGLYKNYEISKQRVNQGAKFELQANEDKTIPTFFIARAHNSNQLYAAAVAKLYSAEVVKNIANMAEEDAQALEVELFVTSQLMGWENIQDRDGEPLPFNTENAKQLFFDLPELFQMVRGFGQQMQNYLKAAEEAAVKN